MIFHSNIFYRQTLSVCLFFFLALSAGAQTPPCECVSKIEAIGKGTGSVSGKATDPATKSPAKSQVVWLFHDGKPVAKTKTGKDGSYQFKKLPEGKYELRICPKGAETICIPGVFVEEGKTAHINLFLNTKPN